MTVSSQCSKRERDTEREGKKEEREREKGVTERTNNHPWSIVMTRSWNIVMTRILENCDDKGHGAL